MCSTKFRKNKIFTLERKDVQLEYVFLSEHMFLSFFLLHSLNSKLKAKCTGGFVLFNKCRGLS